MDIVISGRHVEVTDAMREHARERVGRLERYSSHLMRATVTLTIEGDRHAAEIIGVVRSKSDAVAKHESHDMYLSIDHAVSKIEKQLRKLEARFKTHRGEEPREE